MARRMLLMRQSSVLCFLTLTTLAGSISNYCTSYFEFPNLLDSQRIISYSNKNIIVEFRVNSSCSTPFNGVYNVIDKMRTRCTFFHHIDGECDNFTTKDPCHCPETGSDLYRVEIPADKGHNQTWRWQVKPSLFEERKIHIVILDRTAPYRTEVSTSNTPATNIVHMQISTLEIIDTQDSKDSNTTGATVATCITIITAVIVTIALLVVKKYKIKVTLRRRLAPQHDLALQEIQERNQQQPDSTPAQPQQQQQQQRRLPEIPGQYQVPSSVPARSGLDARRSVGRVSHVYEVVGGYEEGEVPEVLKTELPDTNLHPRPPAQEMTAAQASKPGIGNGLYFHIHPNK